MKIIEIKNLTNEQWVLYLHLLNGIKKKFGKDCLIDDGDWKEFRDYYSIENKNWNEFKKERLEFIEKGKIKQYSEYILINEGRVIGWAALKLNSKGCELLFETIYDNISDVIKLILDLSENFMNDNGKTEVSYWTHDKRKKEVFKKLGIGIEFKMHKTKLSKEDIDAEIWRQIVDSNKNVNNLKLVFCNEIPEDSYQDYVDFFNEIRIDMEYFNPKKPVLKEYTIEKLKEKINSDREDEDPYYVYILYDANKIAAVCSVYIEHTEKTVLNHNGALTAVSRKHRGKNLAKYLKAKMYLKILEDYHNIDHIFTDTYPWNKYMYKINEELGFKPYRIENNYVISKEFFGNKIQ